MTVDEPAPDADYCSYEQFGRRFFEHAVSEERILDALSDLTGSAIEFGPIGAGPARLAKVSATGEFGTAGLSRLERDDIAFELTIPVVLLLIIDLSVDRHRFHADVEVRVRLTARAAEPLRVLIDIDPPSTDDVTVVVRAEGLRASLLQIAASVDHEIRRFIARFIAREIEKPHIRRARDIDVGSRMDTAWSSRKLDGEIRPIGSRVARDGTLEDGSGSRRTLDADGSVGTDPLTRPTTRRPGGPESEGIT